MSFRSRWPASQDLVRAIAAGLVGTFGLLTVLPSRAQDDGAPLPASTSASAPAQTVPPILEIREIRFEGNRTTRARVMQRELVIAVGDPADPARIERSRQAIQDLALFRAVSVEQTIVEDGVQITFRVKERFFYLPLPLIEANSDGDLGLGGQLTANNLFGLNHTLRFTVVSRTFQDGRRPDQLSYFGSYFAPLVAGTRNSIFVNGGHTDRTVVRDNATSYEESFDAVEGQVLRTLNRDGLLSQGWTLGGGLRWQEQAVVGDASAPLSFGTATGLVGSASYRDIRFANFSETGISFSARSEVAVDGFASDYGYSRHSAGAFRSWALGDTPHQTVSLLGSTGVYFGGAQNRFRNEFTLGGARLLRGYNPDTAQGDFFYYGAAEYLRPVIWDALRLLVIAEAGSAWRSPTQTNGQPVFASVGVGLRLRINYVVNLQFEAGVAYPLVRGNGVQLFGGGGG